MFKIKLKSIIAVLLFALICNITSIEAAPTPTRPDDYHGWINYFKDYIKEQPENYEFWGNLGNVYNEMGNYEEALKCFDKSIAFNPTDIDTMLTSSMREKGDTLCSLGRYTEALKIYDDVEKLHNLTGFCNLEKAYALYKLGKYYEALSYCNENIKSDPSYYCNYPIKAAICIKLKKYWPAISFCNVAINGSANIPDAYCYKAIAFGMLGKYTDAINTVNKAIKINPKFGYCYYAKACIYSAMNKKQDAVKNLAVAIKLTRYLKLDAKTDDCFKNIKGLKQYSDLIK